MHVHMPTHMPTHLQPSDHVGHLLDGVDGGVVHARRKVVLEELVVERVLAHPEHDGAGEEEILELVGVSVGAHVEQVLVAAELFE